MLDNIKASMGSWPFQCDACGQRFTATRRYLPARPEPAAQHRPQPHRAERDADGPAMAFKRQTERPTAKVVIEADDDVQLDQILSALHRAVSSYQPGHAGAYAR